MNISVLVDSRNAKCVLASCISYPGPSLKGLGTRLSAISEGPGYKAKRDGRFKRYYVAARVHNREGEGLGCSNNMWMSV